jgi:hypothetical protein
VLVPKTVKLADFLGPYAGSTVAILLLTVGSRRRVAIEQALEKARISVPLAVAELGQFTGQGV